MTHGIHRAERSSSPAYAPAPAVNSEGSVAPVVLGDSSMAGGYGSPSEVQCDFLAESRVMGCASGRRYPHALIQAKRADVGCLMSRWQFPKSAISDRLGDAFTRQELVRISKAVKKTAACPQSGLEWPGRSPPCPMANKLHLIGLLLRRRVHSRSKPSRWPAAAGRLARQSTDVCIHVITDGLRSRSPDAIPSLPSRGADRGRLVSVASARLCGPLLVHGSR